MIRGIQTMIMSGGIVEYNNDDLKNMVEHVAQYLSNKSQGNFGLPSELESHGHLPDSTDESHSLGEYGLGNPLVRNITLSGLSGNNPYVLSEL